MAINTGKVVVGGLAAGVVGNVLGYLLYGLWLGPKFEAEIAAAAPALAGRGQSSTATTATIVLGFVVGLLLVWLYAAIRPRFGPGPKTAIIAAIAVWILGIAFHIDLWLLGLTSTGTYVLATVAGLIQSAGASWVGAMLYKEEGAGATM